MEICTRSQRNPDCVRGCGDERTCTDGMDFDRVPHDPLSLQLEEAVQAVRERWCNGPVHLEIYPYQPLCNDAGDATERGRGYGCLGSLFYCSVPAVRSVEKQNLE